MFDVMDQIVEVGNRYHPGYDVAGFPMEPEVVPEEGEIVASAEPEVQLPVHHVDLNPLSKFSHHVSNLMGPIVAARTLKKAAEATNSDEQKEAHRHATSTMANVVAGIKEDMMMKMFVVAFDSIQKEYHYTADMDEIIVDISFRPGTQVKMADEHGGKLIITSTHLGPVSAYLSEAGEVRLTLPKKMVSSGLVGTPDWYIEDGALDSGRLDILAFILGNKETQNIGHFIANVRRQFTAD
jgi:hypothetical protein